MRGRPKSPNDSVLFNSSPTRITVVRRSEEFPDPYDWLPPREDLAGHEAHLERFRQFEPPEGHVNARFLYALDYIKTVELERALTLPIPFWVLADAQQFVYDVYYDVFNSKHGAQRRTENRNQDNATLARTVAARRSKNPKLSQNAALLSIYGDQREADNAARRLREFKKRQTVRR